MDYGALERICKRLRLLRVLLVCLLFLGIVFVWSPSLSDLLAPEPDYNVIFERHLSRVFHEATGIPVIGFTKPLHIEEDEDKLRKEVFEKIKLGAVPAWTDNLWKEEERLQFEQRSKLVRVAEFALIRDEEEAEPLLFMGFYDTVANPRDLAEPDLAKPLQRGRASFFLGAPPRGMYVYLLFSVVLQVKELKLQNLHWRSKTDPDLARFYARFPQLVKLWSKNFTAPDARVVMKELRDEASSRFRFNLKLLTYFFLPLLFLMILGSTGELWLFYLRFRSYKLLPYARRIHQEFSEAFPLPTYKEFLRSADLVSLEQKVLEEMRSFRQTLEARAKLKQKGELAKERELLSRLSGEAGTTDPKLLKRQKLGKFKKKLEELSQDGWDETAWELKEQALNSQNINEALSLLKQAIAIQIQANGASGGETEQAARQERRSKIFPQGRVYYLKLEQIVYEKFELEDLLPPAIDVQMAKAIVAVLFQFGPNVRFEAHHRRRSTLEDKVRSFYTHHLHQDFGSQVFEETKEWFERQGFLGTFDDHVKDGNYVLCPRGKVPTEIGQQLISRMVKLTKDFRAA